MDINTFKSALGAISATMDQSRDYLIELDQQNGDGDLGISMSEGFRAACKALLDSEQKDMGAAIMQCALAFNEAAPSTLGTIISFGFFGMAKALKGKESVDFRGFAESFNAGVERIMLKSGAKPGEKTIIDALYPAAEAMLAQADDPTKAVCAAYEAAKAGSEATKNMRAVHGRAVYYGEKSIGVLDGGSVAGKIIIKSIKEYVKNL